MTTFWRWTTDKILKQNPVRLKVYAIGPPCFPYWVIHFNEVPCSFQHHLISVLTLKRYRRQEDSLYSCTPILIVRLYPFIIPALRVMLFDKKIPTTKRHKFSKWVKVIAEVKWMFI
jgi:hypothetical protein